MADIIYIYGVATLLMSILTILGNAMIIFAFQQGRSLRLRPSNLLILAVSISDLIYGIHLFVYFGITISGYPYGEIGCMISVFTEYTYNISNILLVALSLDRLLLVSLSYSKYTKWQSKSRIKLQISICYAIGMATSIVEVSLWNYAKRVNTIAASIDFDLYCLYPAGRMKSYGLLVAIGYFCVPVVVVAILCSVFFALLRLRIKKTGQIGCSTISGTQPNEQSTTSTQGDVQDGDDNENRSAIRKRYLKPAVTLAALVTAMSLSSLPYCTYTIVVAVRPELNNFEVIYVMLLIAQLNPHLDPVFYGATQRSIQKYYKKKVVKLLQLFNLN
ncbi:melanopsin-B-like [Amphiura filiformis]|uniref:melanopsin-B-like n=1 Tax=Amphiura filiformis TaxID=82378 RepID=UPI003B225F97